MYDWEADVPKYVKQEFAEAVAAALAKSERTAPEPPNISDEVRRQQTCTIWNNAVNS